MNKIKLVLSFINNYSKIEKIKKKLFVKKNKVKPNSIYSKDNRAYFSFKKDFPPLNTKIFDKYNPTNYILPHANDSLSSQCYGLFLMFQNQYSQSFTLCKRLIQG